MQWNGNTKQMKQDDSLRDAALLVGRTILGASIAAHGAQKLFGWFGGPGPKGTQAMMAQLGFEPEFHATAASLAEIGAGVLIATGALGPVGPALLASVMTTAVGSVHLKNGYWNTNQGFEMNTMYALLALLLATGGFGRASFDHAVRLPGRGNSMLGVLAFAGGVAGGLLVLSQRQPAPNPNMKQEWPRGGETGTIGAPAENVIPDL